ncbi:hypothetical protein AMJ39_08730 [candidate division TA06 bacterium DG_24]|uniref:FPG-type domain-containing protein n=1 Tax=candidate division TA06 bacterium DG_24 TaxID=1703770 RepID=A0A0S7WR25_UNCT6|nr:MAG: hypothetical protein AMJ39_08730 [candidate division TA06 bacterium DG_24]
MIELPEAATIARQLDEVLRGRRVVSGEAGVNPHKWVFYKPSRRVLGQRLPDKVIGGATAIGRGIHVKLRPKHVLLIDDFGGRVLYHRPEEKLPKKYHLLMRAEDESALTVAIQGWGFIGVLTERELRDWVKKRGTGAAVSPVGTAFTLGRFNDLFDHYEAKEKDSVKTFFTNGKSVAGIGNGYLQDILFRAKIDPRRKVSQIAKKERTALYRAVRDTIKSAISLHGRECERDLYGAPGGYMPVMDRHAAGKPCPECGTAIVKISYLGGSCYLCPACQK